jgi:hypothetical protein
MKTKKILVSCCLVAGLVSTSSLTTFAKEGSSVSSQKEANGIINLENVKENKDTVISDVLTFSEITEQIAIDEGISKTEAANRIITQQQKTSNLSARSATQVAVAATYRTISSSFSVTSTYKPSVRFYCQTSEGGGFRGIVKILNVNLNRAYSGISKQFSGSVYTKLEDPNRIFWIVNGDFYNNGTTSGGGGVDIGVGGAASINFNVSYSSNHYKYAYKEAYTYF